MRAPWDQLTPIQKKKVVAIAVALATIVGGFATVGDDSSPVGASPDASVRSEESTVVTQSNKAAFSVKVGSSSSTSASQTVRTIKRSVITEE